MSSKLAEMFTRVFRKRKNRTHINENVHIIENIHINELPVEILSNIFMKLSSKNYTKLRSVCKLWREICPNLTSVYLISDPQRSMFFEFYLKPEPLTIFAVLSGFGLKKRQHRHFLSKRSEDAKNDCDTNAQENIQNLGKFISRLTICGKFLNNHFALKSFASFTNLTCLDLINFHIPDGFDHLFPDWIQHFGHRLHRFQMLLISDKFADESLDLIVQHLNPRCLKSLGVTLRRQSQLSLVSKQFPLITDFVLATFNVERSIASLSKIYESQLWQNLETFKHYDMNLRELLDDEFKEFSEVNVNYLSGLDSIFICFNQLRHLHLDTITDENEIESICRLTNLESFEFSIHLKDLKDVIQHLSLLKRLNSVVIRVTGCTRVNQSVLNAQMNEAQPLTTVRRLVFVCPCYGTNHFTVIPNQKNLLSLFPNISSLIISFKLADYSLKSVGQSIVIIDESYKYIDYCSHLLITCIKQMIHLKNVRILVLTNCSNSKLHKKYIGLKKQFEMHNSASNVKIKVFDILKTSMYCEEI